MTAERKDGKCERREQRKANSTTRRWGKARVTRRANLSAKVADQDALSPKIHLRGAEELCFEREIADELITV